MLGSLLVKPEYFEIEDEFLSANKYDLRKDNNPFLPIRQSVNNGLEMLKYREEDKMLKYVSGVGKCKFSEELFDTVYNEGHIENLSNEMVQKMKTFYIGKIFGVLLLDFDFFSEKQLYDYLQMIKGKMSYSSPESASGLRKKALMLYLQKKYGYVTGGELISDWRETGNFFHVPDTEQETVNIYKYLEREGDITTNIAKVKTLVRSRLVNRPSFVGKEFRDISISDILDFFDNDLLLTSEETDQQLELIKKLFPLYDYQNILDLGCGKGRISNCLASDGYNITGVDKQDSLIKIAESNKNPYVDIDFLVIDYSDPNISGLDKKFDGICYLYDSGVEIDELKRFLKNSNRFLREGGRIMLDFLNIEGLSDQISEQELIGKYSLNGLGIDKVIKKRFKDGDIETTYYEVTSSEGDSKTLRYEHHLYKKKLLLKLLEENGFEVEYMYGDYMQNKHTSDSKRLIIVADKKSEVYQKTHETQGQGDMRNVVINKVGIRNVATSCKINIFDGVTLQGKLSCSAYLPADQKGTHMSRMSLLNTKIFNKEVDKDSFSDVMGELYKSLGTDKVFLEIDGECIREKKSPITNLGGYEPFEVKFLLEYDESGININCQIGIYGMSLCPASKKNSQYGAHNQRSKIVLTFPVTESFNVIEEYISTLEKAFSCRVYPTLKIEDEIFVTESSYLNPKFVEDIIRDAVVNLNNEGLVFEYIEVENYESIHTHNAFAKIFNKS